jgi:galactokinase
LLDSAYNERRAQCEAAARFFGVPALRDVSIEQFEAQADRLDGVVRRRARHVVTENARTLQAAQAMLQEDAVELGRLISSSHASLRDDFAVSTDELDKMVTCTSNARSASAGCYGARMMGAGFGGCAIALIPHIYLCAAADGAEVVPHIP